jgi:ribosomal protein S18 acetylase RimI-like enzyme
VTVTIRPLDAAEAGAIVPLLHQVQALHVAAHPDLFRADVADADIASELTDWLARDGVSALVAASPEGALVGYLICEIEDRPATALMVEVRRRAVLHHIAVDAAWRRRGVATRLVAALRARLRDEGITRVRTVYYAFNDASAALMRSAGLVPLMITAEGEA